MGGTDATCLKTNLNSNANVVESFEPNNDSKMVISIPGAPGCLNGKLVTIKRSADFKRLYYAIDFKTPDGKDNHYEFNYVPPAAAQQQGFANTFEEVPTTKSESNEICPKYNMMISLLIILAIVYYVINRK